MAQPKIRFAFTIAEGPNAGLTTGAWIVWVNKEDTYIAPAELGGVWKGSLHADAAWQWAVTKEEFASPVSVWPGPDRAPWKFEPTPFSDGRRLAFVICVYRHALLELAPDPKAVHIRVEDRWDEVTLACIWMTEPGVALRAERLVGGPLSLASGRQVWVAAKSEPVPGGVPEQQAVSSMVQAAFPEEHGVSAPGVFVRGVHVG